MLTEQSVTWQLKKETIDEAEYANMPNWVFRLKVQKMSRCCIILSIMLKNEPEMMIILHWFPVLVVFHLHNQNKR
jgi:hypothetical protein